MPTSTSRDHRFLTDQSRRPLLAATLAIIAAATGLSAHTIRSIDLPDRVSAFVSSPNPGSTDAPIPIAWPPTGTNLTVACFYVANTSPPDPDAPDWPRITSIGFELPDSPSGFTLLTPVAGEWQLVENVERSVGPSGVLTLDVAIVARVNPTGRTPGSPSDLRGLPPGQARTDTTPFCVSGPFPDELPRVFPEPTGTVPGTIENLLNGVVVGFHGVAGRHQGADTGIWAVSRAQRPIPMYP